MIAPNVRYVPLAEFLRLTVDDVAAGVEGHTTVLERDGGPVAVVVSYDDFIDTLQRLAKYDAPDRPKRSKDYR